MAWRVVLALVAVTGCTEVPTAGDLHIDEEAEESELPYRSVPEQAPIVLPPAPAEPVVATPTDGPKVVVSDYDLSDRNEDDLFEGTGTALCPFTVEAPGFPAVSEDGSKFTYWVAEALSSSDGQDELNTFRIVDVATDTVEETIVVVDGEEFGEEKDSCRRLWRKAKIVAERANRELAKRRWNVMEPFGALIPYQDGFGMDDEERAKQMAMPASERPVELIRQHGEAIVRIPGVKVLGRTPAEWNAPWQEGCGGFSAIPAAAFADRETGVVVVEVQQMAGPCYCYAETLFHSIDVDREAFVLIETRNAHYQAVSWD
ncbi:MAG: hypothetical protein AAF721_13230 [Myxococcota bacterium]